MEKDVSTYLSYASESNISALKSIQNTYISQISSASSEINKVDFSGWQDDISSKLSSLSSSMKNVYIKTISSEVNTGNLTNLINLVTQLREECLAYQTAENKSYTLNLSDSDKALYDDNKINSMSQEGKNKYYDYKSKVNARKEELSQRSQNIDSILSAIKSLEFNKSYEAPDFTAVEVPAEEQQMEEEPFEENTPQASRTEDLIGRYMVNQNGVYYRDVIEVIETTEDGKVKRTYVLRDYDINSNMISERADVTVIVDSNDPAVGTVIENNYDDNTYTETFVERDSETGELKTSVYKRDMETGEIIIGASNYENMPVTNDTYTVEIESPDGKTSQEVNIDNPVERAQLMLDYRRYSLQYDGADGTDMGFLSMLNCGGANIGLPSLGIVSFDLK